jgi:hypothetical protein
MDLRRPAGPGPGNSNHSTVINLQEDAREAVSRQADSSGNPEELYRRKYLELLNRQLMVIRDQRDLVPTKPQPLAVSYPASPAQSKPQPAPKKRPHLGSILAFWATAALIPLVAFWGVLDESVVYGLGESERPTKQVAGVRETQEDFQLDEVAYKDWIKGQTGLHLSSSDDLDEDGLTNGEEFLLQTDPKHAYTCKGDKTDLENVLKLIDPVTCEGLKLDEEQGLARFSQVIHVPTVSKKLFAYEESEQSVDPVGDSLYEVFQVDSLSDIDFVNESAFQREIELSKKREEYSETLKRIDQYIINNRSYEEFDRNHATPVGAAVYLETSIKYDVPLKYVLTVARLESRFGTDRYTRSGNLTRPGAHQNIFSIGLDDSGNNLTYSSWEEGVYAFGRWYSYFDDKGVPDCQKWRIYNPNGDYCAKVEKYAAEVQAYVYG